MASYSNSTYSNSFYDLTGVYFNPTSSSSTSSINISELDARYLKLSGGTISNNLIITNSLDVQTSMTLPTIGNVEEEIQSKQAIITDGDLSIDKTSGLQTELTTLQDNINLKQNIITDGDLTIDKTNGLQSSLTTLQDNIDLKQNTINDGDLSISKTSGLQSSLTTLQDNIDLKQNSIGSTTRITLNGVTTDFAIVAGVNVEDKFDELDADITTKQNIITDGSLSISRTLNLQSSLDTLQDNIDLKQDIIPNFEVNGSVNFDTTGTNFDTLVIRRVNGITGFSDFVINLNEVDVWINNTNILVENSSTLISTCVSWSNKAVNIGFQQYPSVDVDAPPSNLYDNNSSDFTNWFLSPVGSPSDVAVIITNIPLTKINDLHTIQVFNSTFSSLGNRAIGLTIELYNSINDPNYETILAQSNEITLFTPLYRFDCPSLDTYTLGFSPSGIYPNNGVYSLIVEEMNVLSFPLNITGDTTISGDLVVGSVNIMDELATKQATITDGSLTIARTSGLQTALDGKLATLSFTSIIGIDQIVVLTSTDLFGTTQLKGTTLNTGAFSSTTALSAINYTISGTPSDTTHAINKGYVDTADTLNTDNISSIQTQIDALTNFVGGGVNFRAYSLSSDTISVGNNLTYNTLTSGFDTEGTYDTSTAQYTIAIAGTYIFTAGWISTGVAVIVNMIRSRSGTPVIIQQTSNGTNTNANAFYVNTTIAECLIGDLIYLNVESGSCKLTLFGTTEPTNQTSFNGSRISN
jgi:hypothetical protein